LGSAQSDDQDPSHDSLGPKPGSADDYAHQETRHPEYEVHELGVKVTEAAGRLSEGTSLSGVKVIRVLPDSPAAQAGLSDEHHIARQVVAGTLQVVGLFVPPVIAAEIALEKSDIGESYDTIIGVDSERVRNLVEFEEQINKSDRGPIIYLSLIRGGHREQIRVYVKVAIDCANRANP